MTMAVTVFSVIGAVIILTAYAFYKIGYHDGNIEGFYEGVRDKADSK
jgi:hypothetical protein